MSGPAYRPIPRYGVREIVPGTKANGCFRDASQPHGVGHNSVVVCSCAWCIEEREPPPPEQPDLFG